MKKRYVSDKDGNVSEVEVNQDEYAELAEAYVAEMVRERDKKDAKPTERAQNPRGYI